MPDRLARTPGDLAAESRRQRRRAARRWWLAAAAVGVVLALIAALAVAGFLAPLGSWIEAFRGWIEGFGAWGMAVFALTYVLATIAMLPCAPLTVIGGLAWGVWAFPLVIATALVGASLAFQIGRTLAQDRVRTWVATRPRSAAVIEAVSEQGWKVVLLLRLSPVVPFNVQNYLFGITSIGFVPYALATAVGILPGASLFLSIGAFGHGTVDPDSRTWNWIFFAVGLAATVVAAALVTRRVLAKLREMEGHERRGGHPAP
jgi:uncharacterized membrane protein YdjX (TVP38/TMEM64 family)